MIDFHTHILPGIDDGAKDVSVSAAMLEMEKEQGCLLYTSDAADD